MIVNINVGIVGGSGNWGALLDQEGIPNVRAPRVLSPEEYSAVVTTDDVDDRELQMMRLYLSMGGAVLCSAKVYAELRQTTYNREFVRYIFSDPYSIFANVGLIDVQKRCRTSWNSNELRTDRNTLAVHVGGLEKGHVIALPFDVAELMNDNRVETKSFYSPEQRLPFERVSSVSKGTLRKLIARSLEILHHRRGIPYAHLWYYPKNAQTLFAFRVDTEYGGPGEINDLYNLANAHGIPMTWFVDTKSQQLFLSLFKGMQRQEIGIHCFEHRTYDLEKDNEANIRQAMRLFELAGLSAKGMAAPFGTWNEGLGKALQACGFDYSSEFGYDYDNLPSYPQLGQQPSTVLQIPVHPITIGSLRRLGYSEEQMKRYLDFVVNQKLSTREPLFFYHHPLDGNHNVLKHLFEVVKNHNIPETLFHDFAQWWKMRLQAKANFDMTDSTLKVSGAGTDESLWVHITRPDGTEAFAPAHGTTSLHQLSWESRPMTFFLPPNFSRIRTFNYRIPLTKSVDFVTKTVRTIRASAPDKRKSKP